MADTFISYRREDTAGYAGRLRDELEERLGRGRVFRDVDTIRPGQDFVDEIAQRVRQCRAFLVLIGREWSHARDGAGRRRLEQDEDYVRLEIATALARGDLLVVPVLVEGASMPAAADLPPSLAALARRQAISLRDDTWDADVDRLAALIGPRRPTAMAARWRVAGAAAAIALVAAWLLWPDRSTVPAATTGGAASGAPAAAGAAAAPVPAGEAAPAAPAAAAPAAAYAIRLPPRQEVAHGRLLYSLVSGSVGPHGAAREVRLRFRISNEGPYGVHLAGTSFRLVAGDRMFTETSGVNKVIEGRFIDETVLSFDVPQGTPRATLRILHGEAMAELPLDLQPTGRPAEDERAPSGDALTRAILFPVQRDPTPLVSADAITLTLRSVSGRRFANLERLRLSVGVENTGRYGWATGSATLRLVAGDSIVAPVEAPNEVVEPASRTSVTYLFDVPPDTRRVTLRAILGETTVEKPFELP